MNKTVGYVRLSTRFQAKETNSLEHHLTKLYLYGLERSQIIVDIESGSKSDRVGYQKILGLIRTGEINKVVVARFDRFIRSSLDWELAIRELTSSGAELEILDEQRIDLTTPDGLLFSRIRAAFAQAEIEELSLRSRKGWEGLRRRKVAMNPPFGYIKVEDRHQLDIVPFLCLLETREEMSRAAIARDVVELFFQRRSLRSTIRALNEKYGIQRYGDIKRPGAIARGMFRFSSSGLKHWLNLPVLRGHLGYLKGKEIYYDTHADQRLISDAEYREIQVILNENWEQRGWGFRAARLPISGLVACDVCRGNCYYNCATHRKVSYPYYQCKNAKFKACENKKTIRMEVLEEAIIKALCQKAEEIAQIAIASSEPKRIDPPELKQLKVQLASLLSIPGKNSAIATAIHQLEQQIHQEERRLEEKNQQHSTDRQMLVQTFSDPLYFKSLPEDEQRQVFHGLVDKVLVKDGAIVEVRLKV